MQAEKQKLQDWGRLKKRSAFLCAQQTGLKWVSSSVIVQINPHPIDTGKPRPKFCFGVTATKKLGNAPVRNRIKRRLRAAIKDIVAADNNPVNSWAHTDIVLIGRWKTAEVPYEQLKKDMFWCLKRLRQKKAEQSA